MERIVLPAWTQLGVMLVSGLALTVLGLNTFLSANGLSLTDLPGFALAMGFGGAVLSLPISKSWRSGRRG